MNLRSAHRVAERGQLPGPPHRVIHITLALASVLGCRTSTGNAAAPPLGASDGGDGGDPDATSDEDATDAAKDASPAFPTRCIGSWPLAPDAGPVPSLQVSPQELWRKTFATSYFSPDFAVSGTQLIFSAGATLHVLASDGSESATYPGTTRISPPTADVAGSIYWAEGKVRSVDAAGKPRWSFALGPTLAGEFTWTSELRLAPSGELLFSASDGHLYALSSSTGGVLWNRSAPESPSDLHFANAGIGVGDTLFLNDSPHDVATGDQYARLTVAGAPVSAYAALYSQRLLAGRYVDSNGVTNARSYVLDRCGQLDWAFPESDSWVVALVGYHDALLATTRGATNDDAYWYTSDGAPTLGPVHFADFATSLGADGTIYATRCSNPQDIQASSLTLVAYSASFSELWTVPLGSPCTYTGTALVADGTLYLSRAIGSASVELIAVRTASPGLAPTAYPTHRGNNRRTNWLGP